MPRPVHRMPNWAIVVITSAALLVGGVLVAHQATASARVSAMTLNICGVVCNKGEVTRVASFVANKTITNKLSVAFIQELCYSQFRRIKTLVEAKGYSTVYTSTTKSGQCDNHDDRWGTGFGMAILVKGRSWGRVVVPLPVTRGAEKRSLLGVNATIGGRSTFVASVHNSPTAKAGLDAQLKAVATFLNAKASKPVIAGGDFNAMPDNRGMGAFYSAKAGGSGLFTELDELHHGEAARSGEATFDAGRKIDYLFVSSAHFKGPHADSAGTSISDHSVYQGTARVA